MGSSIDVLESLRAAEGRRDGGTGRASERASERQTIGQSALALPRSSSTLVSPPPPPSPWHISNHSPLYEIPGFLNNTSCRKLGPLSQLGSWPTICAADEKRNALFKGIWDYYRNLFDILVKTLRNHGFLLLFPSLDRSSESSLASGRLYRRRCPLARRRDDDGAPGALGVLRGVKTRNGYVYV